MFAGPPEAKRLRGRRGRRAAAVRRHDEKRLSMKEKSLSDPLVRASDALVRVSVRCRLVAVKFARRCRISAVNYV